jgi:hypothetical protein
MPRPESLSDRVRSLRLPGRVRESRGAGLWELSEQLTGAKFPL